MKLILIIFDVEREEEIHQALADAGIKGFTSWGPVYGKGAHSDPRMGTQVWPGDNLILITAVSEEEAMGLRDTLRSRDLAARGVKVLELTALEWF